MNRKLYRVREGQMVAGVCTGLGKYLDVDPTIIRVLFALLAVFGGGGVLVYLVLMIVMPEEPQPAANAAPPAPPAADEPPAPVTVDATVSDES